MWRKAREFGVPIANQPVCEGHSDPLSFVTSWTYDRPEVSGVLGPRGGGKSYLAGFATHLDSLRRDGHGTRILGGSLAQSQQVYNALKAFDKARPGDCSIYKTSATYHKTGSDVEMLSAGPKSVRGPHVPTLRLDEIDEIDPDIRESAMGMCMDRHGVRASVSMTSTWHKLGGPMAELIERGRGGEFPFWTFCAFEVLERCPEERSGSNLERCPECPLMKWCHDGPTPKAKRSNGHYAIESLIQKIKTVSLRVFEADYLCLGPKADGLWFSHFDVAKHASDPSLAEYDPYLPVHVAIDSGVYTGAVFYQVKRYPYGLQTYHVFADYLSYDVSAEKNASALQRKAETHCSGNIDVRWTDPAGGSRNPVGPTVMAEYERSGLPLIGWPRQSIADSISVLESCVEAADGSQRLWIHPRCRHLIDAFRGYRRAKRGGQYMDWPEDPQHPFEDLMDALRGGVVADEKPPNFVTYGPNPYA